MTEAEFADLPLTARKLIPGFEPTGSVTPLEGGLLNRIYRIHGKSFSVIAKYAPPYVAANPEIPLDAARQLFEAKALSLFSIGGILNPLVNPSRVRNPGRVSKDFPLKVPQVLAHDPARHILFMEDAGPEAQTLDQLAHPKSAEADEKIGTMLAELIAGMHVKTAGNACIAKTMNNASIQKTRYVVQYQPAARYLRKAGIPDYESLGRELELLGREFMKPGVCLTMGDLWPRSLLWNENVWYLIDWEFSHFGSPAQDTGHFLAHLWMLEHQSPKPEKAKRFASIRNAFFKTYQRKIEDLNPDLLSSEIKRQTVLHAAAEILARTTGAFQDGYVYEGLEPDDPIVQEAIKKAAKWMRNVHYADLVIF